MKFLYRLLINAAILIIIMYMMYGYLGDGPSMGFELLGHQLELTNKGVVLGLVVIFFIVIVLLRFLENLWTTPKKLGEWNKTRNKRLSQTKFGDGFLALMKGDWKRAEKQLMAKAQHSEVPFVNYLAAAQAAQEQGKYAKRDEYLALALQKAPNDKLAINMTKARLHQQLGDADKALYALQEVEDQGRKNPQYIAMLVQAYDELDENEKLESLLPQAKKMGALPSNVLVEIQAELDLEKFNDASDKERAWKELAKTSQKDPDFIAAYAEYHMNNNRPDMAEKLIRTALKAEWDESLVNLYGRIKSTNRKKLLRQVDGWLLARPESAELHLAAGRLAIQDRDIERAQQEFELAIKMAGLPEAFEELGLLHESEQDLRKALTLYRTGIASMNGNYSPALPNEGEAEDDAAKEGELMPKDA